MKTIYSLFISFIFCISFTINAQIEVKTINPDGTPNSNCYFSTDSVQVGLTNREGNIFIDQSFKGKEFLVKELETGWETQIVLNGDTSIVLENIQTLSEVKITPRNTKKLYKEIMELNQNRLPEKLNLRGQVFFAELYIIKNERKGGESDTILDVFSCEVIIKDVFGEETFLVKDPVKYREGSTSSVTNQEVFTSIETVIVPLKNYDKRIVSNLNYENFEMNKFRKYNSSLNIDEKNRHLKFNDTDSSTAFGFKEKEFLYSWRKEDSSLIHLSRYSKLGNKSKGMMSSPFGNKEFSNPNSNYSDSYMLSELESRLMNTENKLSTINNVFVYFDIDGRLNVNEKAKGFKEIKSFENLYNETKSKRPDENITLAFYPLRFPVSVFFN